MTKSDQRIRLPWPPQVARMICFDWYDGPVEGLIEDVLLTSYAFEKLAWDSGQDRRIFLLSELPANAFSQVAQMLSFGEKPTWPIWAPSWQYPDSDVRLTVEVSLESLLILATPRWICETRDSFRTITHARLVDGEVAAAVGARAVKLNTFDQWQELLRS